MTDLPKYVPDKDELKRLLPIKYVCARLGIFFDTTDHAVCPFHDDNEPSLYTFQHADGEVHWSCQPCGVSGDIYTLLMRYHGCGFKEALQRALELYDELPEDWSPPPPPTPVKKTISDWATYIEEGQERASDSSHSGYMAAFVGYANISQPALCAKWDDYIRRAWRWGVGVEGEILIPHYDEHGNLRGCKTRLRNGEKGSLKGSSYSYGLYGSWQPRRRGHRAPEALLTEGESDCIFTACQVAREKLQDKLDVFSLPSGANAFDESWLGFLKSYGVVYLAFDPDKAGIGATWTWVKALAAAGQAVKICFLPLGRDIREAQPTISYLIETAKTPLDDPQTIATNSRGSAGYYRLGKDGEVRQVTNWHLEPVARLCGAEDEAGFDVELHHRGSVTSAAIKLADLASTRELTRWCNRHGLIFTGRDDDLKRIAEHLAWRGSVVPEVYQTDQVGLQSPPDSYRFAGPSVVFPAGYVGKMPWRYVPSTKTVNLERKVLLPTEGRFEWGWLEDFLALSTSEVTHPLLAWLIASARRPEAAQFPLLFIAGSSGVGKSTLARLSLRLLGSAVDIDLGANTPFILIKTLASTTSLPIFVDEWTRMSRKDTRESFQGAIPILYAGGTAERGQADLSSTVYRLTSPVIVAGEDRFMLDREIERMVAISPSRLRQSPDALGRVIDKPLERFGQLLHSWLATEPELPRFAPTQPTRVDYNRHVLEVGWETLRALLAEASRYEEVPDIPKLPNLEEITATLEDDDENVYSQAILIGMSMRDQDNNPVVWADPEGRGTWVRFQSLVGLIQTRGVDLALPGGSRAMKAYFEENYGALELGASVVPPSSFTPVRAWLIQGHELPAADDSRLSWTPQ